MLPVLLQKPGQRRLQMRMIELVAAGKMIVAHFLETFLHHRFVRLVRDLFVAILSSSPALMKIATSRKIEMGTRLKSSGNFVGFHPLTDRNIRANPRAFAQV